MAMVYGQNLHPFTGNGDGENSQVGRNKQTNKNHFHSEFYFTFY